jgi:hypothetical protein
MEFRMVTKSGTVDLTNNAYYNYPGFFTYEISEKLESYIPKQIIIREDSKTTIVIWEDDSKTIVHCSEDEPFVPEFGVAMATMNKIYGNRTKFKKFINEKIFVQDKVKKK